MSADWNEWDNEHADTYQENFGEKQHLYYEDSGAVPILGILLMLIGGGIAAAVLSVAYAFFAYWAPVIGFIGAAVLAIFTGEAIKWGIKIGKVRSENFSMLVGFIMGCLALYLSWVAYLWIESDYQLLLVEPQTLWEGIRALNIEGLWTLFGWKPTGVPLWIFWTLEAGLIVLVACGTPLTYEVPFCEQCYCWTKLQRDPFEIEIMRETTFVGKLENGEYEILPPLYHERVRKNNCFVVELYGCPQCEDSNYLAVEHQVITIDSDGDEDKTTNDVLRNLRIPREILLEWMELKPVRGGSSFSEDSVENSAESDSPTKTEWVNYEDEANDWRTDRDDSPNW